MDELKQDLKDAQAGLFGKRKTMQEALDYANRIAVAEGMSEAHMTTAIMVYHNTLLSVIGEGIDLLEKEAKHDPYEAHMLASENKEMAEFIAKKLNIKEEDVMWHLGEWYGRCFQTCDNGLHHEIKDNSCVECKGNSKLEWHKA